MFGVRLEIGRCVTAGEHDGNLAAPGPSSRSGRSSVVNHGVLWLAASCSKSRVVLATRPRSPFLHPDATR